MKRILVTGSNGQVGKALQKEVRNNIRFCDTELLWTSRTQEQKEQAEKSLLLERQEKLDITDQKNVNRMIKEFRPELIINCAAYTAVDKAEEEKEKAFLINAEAPRYLAEAAAKIGAELIHISTDYVFDGKANRPYQEGDRTSPQNMYGMSKLAGEQAVLSCLDRSYIVRTAWLYGEGKNFVRTMVSLGKNQCEKKRNKQNFEPIRVVEDQYGNPTSAKELTKVLLLLADSKKYGIYHATCQGKTNWYMFACEIFKQLELEVEIIPISTKEYVTKAIRPAFSVLDGKKLEETFQYTMAFWKQALKEYLTEMDK